MNIYKLNVLYQISLSQDSKNNFLLIGMSFNHAKCQSEMHQFESADPVLVSESLACRSTDLRFLSFFNVVKQRICSQEICLKVAGHF